MPFDWNTLLFGITTLLLGGTLLLALIRLIKGPTQHDRVIALELFGSMMVVFACYFAVLFKEPLLFDAALGMATLGFLGSSAVGRWLERNP
jgi:multicomponent Na+:H+ antiporter subunit F